MDLSNIYDAWGDILKAIKTKDTDPELFHRLFIGSITEDDNPYRLANHATENFQRHSPKLMRTPICFLDESAPAIYLTPREAQCVAYVFKGYTHPQTGDAIGLSKRTVEFYIKNVRRKLNCQNKEELIKIVNESDFPEKIDTIVNRPQYP